MELLGSELVIGAHDIIPKLVLLRLRHVERLLDIIVVFELLLHSLLELVRDVSDPTVIILLLAANCRNHVIVKPQHFLRRNRWVVEILLHRLG